MLHVHRKLETKIHQKQPKQFGVIPGLNFFNPKIPRVVKMVRGYNPQSLSKYL